jgi:site-specific recombinase XerD
MIDEMMLRGFCPRTRQAYIGAVKGLARHYRRSPDTISNEEVRDFVVYLMTQRKLASASVRVHACGFRLFYSHVLKREDFKVALPPCRGPKKLPEVLSLEEVRRVLKACPNPKYRIMLALTYGLGLRVSEVVKLKVTDIEGDRRMVRVEEAKGRKDRYVPISDKLLDELRAYYRRYRPRYWLFPSQNPRKHLSISLVQRAYGEARRTANIQRGSGVHTLRHSYATHLLEAGYDIETIQRHLGHRDVRTTFRYIKVSERMRNSLRSPFDLLGSRRRKSQGSPRQTRQPPTAATPQQERGRQE